MPRSVRTVLVAFTLVAAMAVPMFAVSAQTAGDTKVSVGSPTGPFPQNKQNEPAIAIDASHPNVLAAGANDEIDNETCAAGDPTTCPFTPGVGQSGVYFSFDSGHSWFQPTYTGLTARDCTGPEDCVPHEGPIGTLPHYDEVGLASGGDPAVAFGPISRNGTFSWSNGVRLYYANLAAALPGSGTFNGVEAVAVSRLDAPATGLTRAIASNENNWHAPVIVSKQNSALFSDKEQVWADNASSSPYFGNAYVCYAGFRADPGQGFTPQPLFVSSSDDGGDTWKQHQITPAATNISSPKGFGRSGCTVRTDSDGVVYVFDVQFAIGEPGDGVIQMARSFDGGHTWTKAVTIARAVDTCNYVELSIARCVMDGVAGARDDLSPAPSVDIANGAPTGADATDRLVLTWVDGRDGLNHEHVMFTTSADGGRTWSQPTAVERAGDRGYYSAPAISPNGSDVWLVYNAFTTPFRFKTTTPRSLVGVVLHASATGSGVGSFTEVHRGVPGDPRGSSQNNLAAEFLGDYVYAAATRTYGAAVWNDTRNAAVCDAVNAYRQALHDEAVATGAPTAEAEEPGGASEGDAPDQGADAATPPAVDTVCPNAFGNSDIYGWTSAT